MSRGGALPTGCGCVLHGSFGRVPPLDTTPLASGGVPQALTLFGGVGSIARRSKKGNADGARGTACRVGLQPCDLTHPKNGLVLHSYAGGAYDKYSVLSSTEAHSKLNPTSRGPVAATDLFPFADQCPRQAIRL